MRSHSTQRTLRETDSQTFHVLLGYLDTPLWMCVPWLWMYVLWSWLCEPWSWLHVVVVVCIVVVEVCAMVVVVCAVLVVVCAVVVNVYVDERMAINLTAEPQHLTQRPA